GQPATPGVGGTAGCGIGHAGEATDRCAAAPKPRWSGDRAGGAGSVESRPHPTQSNAIDDACTGRVCRAMPLAIRVAAVATRGTTTTSRPTWSQGKMTVRL